MHKSSHLSPGKSELYLKSLFHLLPDLFNMNTTWLLWASQLLMVVEGKDVFIRNSILTQKMHVWRCLMLTPASLKFDSKTTSVIVIQFLQICNHNSKMYTPPPPSPVKSKIDFLLHHVNLFGLSTQKHVSNCYTITDVFLSWISNLRVPSGRLIFGRELGLRSGRHSRQYYNI